MKNTIYLYCSCCYSGNIHVEHVLGFTVPVHFDAQKVKYICEDCGSVNRLIKDPSELRNIKIEKIISRLYG